MKACLSLLAPLAAAPFLWAGAPGRLVNDPLPVLGTPWRPSLTNISTISRHETVSEWHLAVALGRRAGLEAKWLGSNMLVHSFGDRVRYFSNEVELEAKASLFSFERAAGLSGSMAGFMSRYWLDTRDGAGAVRALSRDFFGPKLIVGLGEKWRPNASLTVMRVRGRDTRASTVVALGLGVLVHAGAEWELAAEGHPFLSNPLNYRKAWGMGARWRANPKLALGGFITNTFGGLSPDTLFGSPFPQYRFEWSYVF